MFHPALLVSVALSVLEISSPLPENSHGDREAIIQILRDCGLRRADWDESEWTKCSEATAKLVEDTKVLSVDERWDLFEQVRYGPFRAAVVARELDERVRRLATSKALPRGDVSALAKRGRDAFLASTHDKSGPAPQEKLDALERALPADAITAIFVARGATQAMYEETSSQDGGDPPGQHEKEYVSLEELAAQYLRGTLTAPKALDAFRGQYSGGCFVNVEFERRKALAILLAAAEANDGELVAAALTKLAYWHDDEGGIETGRADAFPAEHLVELLEDAGIEWESLAVPATEFAGGAFADLLFEKGSEAGLARFLDLSEGSDVFLTHGYASHLPRLIQPGACAGDDSKGHTRTMRLSAEFEAAAMAAFSRLALRPNIEWQEAVAWSKGLSELCREEAVEPLVALTASPYSAVREQGLVGLRMLGMPEPPGVVIVPPVILRVLVNGKPLSDAELYLELSSANGATHREWLGATTNGEGETTISRDLLGIVGVGARVLLRGFDDAGESGSEEDGLETASGFEGVWSGEDELVISISTARVKRR